jgi:Protein of unknown function (DUF4242)
MPKFIIEREIAGIGELSDPEIREISKKSRAVLEAMGPSIQWLQSHVAGDKMYCVYLAPDEQTVRSRRFRGDPSPVRRESARGNGRTTAGSKGEV